MKLVRLVLSCGLAAIGLIMVSSGFSQEKSDQTIGQKVDQSIGEIRQEAQQLAGQVREGLEQIRAKVEQMSVAARVYARVHWDKALTQASVWVDVDKDGVVTLTGTVPTEAAKAKAGTLADDTVGVQRVVNNLKVVAATRP